MKTKLLLVILKIIFIHAVCHAGVITEKITLPDGTKISAESGPDRWDNGNIKSCRLFPAVYINISQNRIKADEINFFENGRIESVRLDAAQTINTPAGDFDFGVSNSSDAGWWNRIWFYESGKFKSGNLKKPQSIKILNNKLIIKDLISFYENGTIKSVQLDNSQCINTPAGIMKFGCHDSAELNTLWFHENGTLKCGNLSETRAIRTYIGNLNLKNEISFYDNGTINTCTLDRPQVVDIFADKSVEAALSGAAASFAENGKLKVSGTLQFYENGKLKIYWLGENKIFKGKVYGNIFLMFSNNGNLLGKCEWDYQTQEWILIE